METLPLDQVRLRAIIENAGLRCTPQRLAVYQQLCESAATPGEVSLDGQSVNTQIARLLSPGDDSVASVAVRQIPPHRPLLAVCQVLRQWIAAPAYVLAGR